MLGRALLLLASAVALTACLIPPLSGVIYHYYSDAWPPAMAAKVAGLAHGALNADALGAAVEAGVFDALEAGPLTGAEVAAATGLLPRMAERLLAVLATQDLLAARADGTYALGGAARAHLLRSGDEYMGGATQLLRELPRGAQLTAVLRGDAPVESTVAAEGHRFWEAFAQHSVAMMEPEARAVSREVVARLGGARLAELRVLDLACGTGVFGFTLARESGRVELTSFDQEHVLGYTRQWAQQFDVARQTSFRSGDMFEADLGGPYGAAIVSHVLHHFDADTSVRLLQRVRAALKPGAVLAVNDYVRDGDVYSPWGHPVPFAFRFVMGVTTHDGDSYTRAVMQDVVERAGFRDVAFVDNAPYGNTVVLGAAGRGAVLRCWLRRSISPPVDPAHPSIQPTRQPTPPVNPQPPPPTPSSSAPSQQSTTPSPTHAAGISCTPQAQKKRAEGT